MDAPPPRASPSPVMGHRQRLSTYVLRVIGANVRGSMPIERPPRKLLIVKVHGMGDSVLIRSLIELLSRLHPEVEIGVMVGASTRELMTAELPVRSHFYDQGKLTPLKVVSAWRDIRLTRYEAIANFEQGSRSGTAFLASLGIQTHVGFVETDDDPKKRLLTHTVAFHECDSMWQSFLRVARVLYPDLPSILPVIRLEGSLESRRWAMDWWNCKLGGDDRFPIALHMGCGPGAEFRRWPLSRFLVLADRLRSRWQDAVIILTGTSRETDLIREFRARFQGFAIDASNLGTLEQTALVLKRCRLLVSNDTGVMHLAAALGTPTVGLFGPNSPAHWAPLGPCATYVRDTTLQCSPCINNYLNIVPTICTNPMQGQCMKDITVESVEGAIERLISFNHDSTIRST
jgi:ADP-heptose:LPS heptosyltransferase